MAALLSLLLFVWDLGGIGLVDETPPLFAASARAMAEGDVVLADFFDESWKLK